MKKLMKHIVISFFVFGIGTLFAQSHSQMEFNCQTCHACETPTKSDPCLIECPREQMMTVHQTPEQSPEIITLNKMKSVEDLYEPVVFSHRLHAEMAGMSGGCEMCHHYNPPGNVVSCSECHSVSRKREDISKPDLKAAFHRQCIDCHREWSGELACESCHELNSSGKTAFEERAKVDERLHPPIVEPTKIVYETSEYDDNNKVTFFHNEHTGLYGFECQDCHQNESCVKCHDRKEPVASGEIELTMKHQKCASCHDTEDNCETCHMNKEMEPFNHKQRTGFDLFPHHAKLSCVQCHQTTQVFTGLSSNCNVCHENWAPDNFDHSITGLKLSENHVEWTCDVCHEDRDFTKTPTCSTCHEEDITYPDFEPGERIE